MIYFKHIRSLSQYDLVIIGLVFYLVILVSYGFHFLEYSFSQTTRIQPSDFAIVTYYAPQKNVSQKVNHTPHEYKSTANITMTNLVHYAQFHGHAIFFMTGYLVDTHSKNAYWGKMDVVEHFMDKGYQWILWTDIDVLFPNIDRSIFTEWIKPQKRSTHLLFVNECIKSKAEVGPIRSGFFAVRNSLEGRSFLKAWRDMFEEYQFVHDPEQHALQDMMKDEKWLKISNTASHSQIHTYPECFNGSSISIHFAGTRKRKLWDFYRSRKRKLLSKTSGFRITYVGK